MGEAALPAANVLSPTFRRLSCFAAVLVTVVGGLVAVGWVFDVPALRSFVPAHGAAVKPNEAVGFILSGAALWLLQAARSGRVRRVAGLVLAGAVGLLGAATLLQDVLDIDLRIDELLILDEPWPAETGARGRMSPNASLAMTLAGLAMCLLPTRGWRTGSFLQMLATVVLGVGLLAVLGYLYDVEGLHRLEYGVTGISLATAGAFIVLGLGILCAAPDRGWMTVFAGMTGGGIVARRLLPGVAVVIILLGWLRLAGELNDLFDATLGTAMFVLATVLLLGGLVWQTSVALHRSDLRRMAAQQDLLEQREWLTTTLLSIGDAVITTDARGRTVLMNNVAEELTGWTQDEAEGQPLWQIFRIVEEKTGRTVEDPVQQVLRGGNVVGLANHSALVRRDGKLLPIQDSAAPIRAADGGVVGVVLVFRDVSRERRAEQELRASEAVKGAIIGNSLDGIITIDADGKIVEFNPAAEVMFGYGREEAIGRMVADLIVPPGARDRHSRGVARYVATGESGNMLGRHVEVTALRADGTEFPIELAVTPIHTSGGRPMFAGHVRDITERKRIQAALEQRASQQRAVVRLGQMALRERDLQKVLQQATSTVAATLDVEFAKVLEITPAGDEMVLRAGVGFDESLIGTAKVPADPQSQAGYTLALDAPLVVDDLRTEQRFRGAPLLRDHRIISGMTCAIVGPGGGPWGVLGAHSTRHRSFTEDDISFLGAVANVLANAIERDEAEASLRRSERLYRGIGESINYGVWVCTPDGRAIYSSPSFQQMTGLTPESAGDLGWSAALHPDDIEETVRAWKQTVAHGDFWEREHRYRGVDGQWHYVLTRGVPIHDHDGRVIYWAGINLDIDSFKRTEEALRRSEERFREIAETIREVFYIVEDNVITYVSSAYEVVWGRARAELYGDLGVFLDSVVEEDRQRVLESWQQRTAGEATEVEFRITRGDGEERWIHDRSYPVVDANGRVVRIVGVANDVTERRRHEEQMQIVMGELNHRVKNTLAVIQSIAMQTARRAPNLEVFQRSFQDRLMSMANAHSLLTRTHWEGASLADIVASELEPRVASAEQYAASGGHIRLRPKAALALHMVVHELATNAGKYGALASDKGRVDVTWRVERTGQEREAVLTWREQTPEPIEPPAESGYGTRLIDQMVEYELDGEVEREYRPDGLECRITFQLSPRDVTEGVRLDGSPGEPARPREDRPARAAAATSNECCRVLVVEDNSMLAMTLCDELDEAGFSVVGPAASLARGIALSEQHDIDAAVLDVDLDGTAVYPLARQLRERNVPFVFVTGYEVSDLPADLRDQAMLRKPVEVQRVRAYLEQELRPV